MKDLTQYKIDQLKKRIEELEEQVEDIPFQFKQLKARMFREIAKILTIDDNKKHKLKFDSEEKKNDWLC